MFNLPHLMYLLRARMAVSLVRTSLHDSWGMSLLYRHPRVDNKDTKVDPKEPQVPLEVCVASLVEGAPASHLLRPGDIIRYERREEECKEFAWSLSRDTNRYLLKLKVFAGDGWKLLEAAVGQQRTTPWGGTGHLQPPI